MGKLWPRHCNLTRSDSGVEEPSLKVTGQFQVGVSLLFSRMYADWLVFRGEMGSAWHQLFPIFIIYSILYIYQRSHKIHYSYIRYIYIYIRYIYIYHVTNHYSYWEDQRNSTSLDHLFGICLDFYRPLEPRWEGAGTIRGSVPLRMSRWELWMVYSSRHMGFIWDLYGIYMGFNCHL